MANAVSEFGRVSIEELKGLNERQQDANADLGEFDVLKGFIPTKQNTLTKINGVKLMHVLAGLGSVKNLCQSNDSRGNIWIQTNQTLGAMFEDEFFQRPIYVPNLSIAPINEEDTMAIAILTHSSAAAANGGTYTTANVWQQAPITEILSQVNADGSPAAFCTLAANQFTLVAGVYRLSGWRVLHSTTTGAELYARIFNVTAAAPAFVGLANEKSVYNIKDVGQVNHVLPFADGVLNLGGTTTFEIQGRMTASVTNVGFGTPSPLGGMRNIFSNLRIIKTA